MFPVEVSPTWLTPASGVVLKRLGVYTTEVTSILVNVNERLLILLNGMTKMVLKIPINLFELRDPCTPLSQVDLSDSCVPFILHCYS